MFPDPIFVFGIPLRWFGLLAAASIFLGYSETEREMRRLKMPVNILPDLAVSILVVAFLGARLFFVLSHLEEYTPLSWNLLKFWQGGIVLYGGLLGGLLGGYAFCRFKKISFPKFSDPVALGLASGLTLSRLGCFAAGCCYGKPTNLPWGIAFNNPETLARPAHAALHPTQLYSFLIGVGIYFVLLFLRDKKSFDGELLLTYLILTSIGRFFVDCFRAEIHPLYFFSALLVFGVSGVFYVRNKFKLNQGVS